MIGSRDGGPDPGAPLLTYFARLSGYPMEAPFAPWLWVEIRQRMGAGVLEVFHGAIIAPLERTKAKRKPAPVPVRRPKPGKDEAQQLLQ